MGSTVDQESSDSLGLPASPPCAFCESEETELFSLFGGQLSTATFWCRGCRTAFEWFKWTQPEPDSDSKSSDSELTQ